MYIQATNVVKAYDQQQVLHNVDLTLDAGQVLGLVGPNGAGKSTLLQAILGLTNYQGDIQVLGKNPSREREKMLEHVAYIADIAVLPRWMRVADSLVLMQQLHPRFDVSVATELLSRTDIKHKAKVKALSKGMKAQLHLALIMAIDAKVLILDEPTLGLDITTRKRFLSDLMAHCYGEDKAIIITTHQIDEVEQVLTHVAFIKQGKIINHNPMDEIADRYQQLTVSDSVAGELEQFNPIARESFMGRTTLMFDGVSRTELSAFGHPQQAKLSDIFVALMEDAA
ncbi:ABC transporter ATP-binding protein [Salinibius halmophilus]|uniref:ABC transporter ATP-binding protein n=1 Tax=Salinibius halmophilus TaxID=1853216 RepID=UPI001314DF81|nr:ABC transporter ATP-binding protein [Salinibius halmophilus]